MRFKQENVRKIQEAAKTIGMTRRALSEAKFIAGSAALEEIPGDLDLGVAQKAVHQLAQEAGVSTGQLARWRSTIWGLQESAIGVNYDISFSVYEELVDGWPVEERAEVLADLIRKAENRQPLVNDIRALLGKRPARVPSRKLQTKEEKAAVLEEYLGDDDVQEELANNPDLRVKVEQALDQADEVEFEKVEQAKGYRKAGVRPRALTAALKLVKNMEGVINLLDEANLSSEDRAFVRALLPQLRAGVDFIESSVSERARSHDH